jgi:hypothetical protein
MKMAGKGQMMIDVCHVMSCTSMNEVKNAMMSAHGRSFFLYSNGIVEIHFAEALTATINVIMYAQFDIVIEIDRNRQVLFDYSALLFQ